MVIVGYAPPLRFRSASILDSVASLGAQMAAGVKFSGLGRDTAAWLANERSLTDSCLRTERAGKSAALTGASRATDLSQYFGAWYKKTDAEAVMELWPGREVLSREVGRRWIQS